MAVTPQEQLKHYRQKRDFTTTLEPSGDTAGVAGSAPSGELRFVVQKHDATRLHFDFRLELDGVLKSWAVTKGPSADPADKRLAVRVEDHPLDYGEFEGTIPEGQYGGGTVMLWDQGTWEPVGDPHEGLEGGDLKFKLNGKRMKGEWVLVHMKGRDQKTGHGPRENWLLIKHKDNHASGEDALTEKFTTSVETGRDIAGIAKGLKSRKKAAKNKPDAQVWTGGKSVILPEFREPQLATLVDEIPEGDGWLFEVKYDGYRAVAAVAGPEVRLYTRNANDWTTQFKRLVEPLSKLTKGSLLLDGEICAIKDGRTDFSTLKDALSSGGDLVYFVFDLLEQDGENHDKLPLVERKARLETLLKRADSPSLQYSEHIVGHGQKVFAAMRDAHQEGVIAKRATAPYRHERTRDWLKIKVINRQEFVIGGWRPSDKKATFASLLLGTWEGDKLVYRGRVGTGFNADSAGELQKALDGLALAKPAFAEVPRDVARHAEWVEPNLVAEIDFTELTPDGHLRHPSFVGLRSDKPAKQVKLETATAPKTSGKAPKRAAKLASMQLTDDMGSAVAERLGVKLTNPSRPVMPDETVTKGQIVAYYEAVGERMLAHMARRALSLVRVPHGQRPFFQKHDSGGFPEALKHVQIELKESEKEDHFYVTDLSGIVGGVQMSTLEFHIWGSRIDKLEQPDRIIFDIDPDEGLDFGNVRDAARHIRGVLKEWGLESVPMVTGGKGIHVIAPLTPRARWPEVKAFCRFLADHLAETEPDHFTSNIRKEKRKGRMFVDCLRNERGSTAVAPFSTRARPGIPCAVPVAWDELDDLKQANAFTLDTAAAKAREREPWPDYFKLRQSITKATLKKAGIEV
jgi:bifunctional non-homologous end joining protein LigD